MNFDELDRSMRVYETTHDHCVLPNLYTVVRLMIDEDQCRVFRSDQVEDHLITNRLAGYGVPRNM